MPSLWSGSLTFGLVSIPVRLEVSRRSQRLSFNLLCPDCLGRINQLPYCPACDEYRERAELKKGYQYQKDEYVVMEPEDFTKAESHASRNIEVIAFVEAETLKPVFLDRTYYLVPEAGAEKGYALLHRGMQETNKVAITRFVMRGKEYIGAVNFADGGLMMHILFHQGEFKHASEVVSELDVEVSSKELDLAEQIIENMSEDFSEEMLNDEYRERLLDIIQQRIDGKSVVVTETKKPAKVVDLMEALKKSLDATSREKSDEDVETSEKKPTRQRKRA